MLISASFVTTNAQTMGCGCTATKTYQSYSFDCGVIPGCLDINGDPVHATVIINYVLVTCGSAYSGIMFSSAIFNDGNPSCNYFISLSNSQITSLYLSLIHI